MSEWVAVVWVDPLTQLSRLMDRDGLSEAEARRRMAVQMPLDQKRRLADLVIDNSGPLARTRERVESIYRQLNV
jgi:dephospho-CoA kinase